LTTGGGHVGEWWVSMSERSVMEAWAAEERELYKKILNRGGENCPHRDGLGLALTTHITY
jgi:hypothetical protein